MYLTKDKRLKHVNLLLITDNSRYGSEEGLKKFHYVWMKNLAKLVGSSLSSNKKKFICDRCLHYFSSIQKLTAHETRCSQLSDCLVKMPNVHHDIIEFKNYDLQEKLPFIVYGDCECLLKKRPLMSDDDMKNTITYQEHKMFNIG